MAVENVYVSTNSTARFTKLECWYINKNLRQHQEIQWNMLMYQQTPPQALPEKRMLKYQQIPEATSRNSVENVDVSTNSTSSFTQ